jgi:hypothetical protein
MHYLALFAVAAGLALALFAGRARAALALLAALLAFAPWIPVLRSQPPEAMAWLREAPSRALPGFLSALGGVGRIPAPFGPTPPRLALVAGAIVGSVLLLLLARASRQDAAARAALFFVLIALGLAFAVSHWRPVAFAGRCEMAVLPVWMWAVARAAPGSRAVRVAAGMAAAFGLGTTAFVVAGPHPRSTPASAVARVARLTHPGDVLLAGPGFYLPSLVEAGRGAVAGRVTAFPPDDAPHPGWFVAAAPGAREEASLRAAMDALKPGQRLWLLLPPSHDTPGVMRVLSSAGTVRELVRQPDAVLLVWSPSAGERPAAPSSAPAS